jgi:hypothetical protein
MLSTSLHAYARLCAVVLSEHGQALAPTPSQPVGSGSHPYKKDHPFHAQSPPPPPAGHPSDLSPLTVDRTAHPSHSHCVGSGASLSFGATSRTKKATPPPPLCFGGVDRAGEFRPSVARLLASSWGSQPCQASAPWAGEACGVHLAEVWPLASHREPCLAGREPCARCVRTRAASYGRPGR